MYSSRSQEQSLERGESRSYSKRSNMSKYLTFGYMSWLIIASLSAFNLYLDYRCSYNNVVPKTYFHVSRSGGMDQATGDDFLARRSISGSQVNETLSFNSTSSAMDRSSSTNSTYQCVSNADCGNGECKVDRDINGVVIGSECECDDEYITVDTDICSYHQLSGLVALLLSIFLGGCGVDRCFISRGNGGCICLGILKAITLGGVGIWYIVDIVLIATANLDDGNGHPLSKI
ncbi:TM2 domain-containing protein [Yasminevirus sp. GU-2018]|uniref:TM2 domain-containing protein n=1 Tax=Yasminevirus sp. GU-2018 TaxID=2420051 RepID=A0A5K0UAT7_9VIRU|nr:TM2 domain-containing protein [Yasminevirus sp. GU-2018]